MSDTLHHADVMTANEAAVYLRLTAIADTPEGALRVLYRFTREGRIKPLKWSKQFLFLRSDLDRFVAEEAEQLQTD